MPKGASSGPRSPQPPGPDGRAVPRGPNGHVPGGSTTSANLSELVSKSLILRAVAVAAKLKIADLIAEGARSADELAHVTGVHAPSLYRLLRALTGLDVLVEDDAGRFSLGPLGEALRTGPASLRERTAWFGDVALWDVWGRLEHSVRTGEPAFEDWQDLKPLEATSFENGVVLLRYEIKK
jgi:DNA-binding transcriptional ArsR family regulator